MSEQASYFRLGLFTIVAAALLLGLIAALGSGLFTPASYRAETYMEQSEGLSVGAPVIYRGVQVGRVSKIDFVGNRYRVSRTESGLLNTYAFVGMELDLTDRDRKFVDDLLNRLIPDGLRARVAPSSLVGPAVLEFAMLDPREYPPPTFSWKPDGAYIPSAPSVLGELTTRIYNLARKLDHVEIQKIGEDFDRLLVSANTAVSEVDVPGLQDSVRSTFDDIRATSTQVRELLDGPDVTETLANAREFSAELKSAAAQIDSILADPRTNEALANLDSTLASASPAVEEVRLLARRLDTLLASQQREIEQIVLTLRRTLENAQDLTSDARENPSRMLFGEPPPRLKPDERGGRP